MHVENVLDQESILQKTDAAFDQTLRPTLLKDFYGQKKVIMRLKVLIYAALERCDPVPHILFAGSPGLGKTSLSKIVANEIGSNIVVTSGPILKKPADLAGILTTLKKKDVLFIDEIHSLTGQVEEYLYSAMEDFRLDIVVDSGPCAHSVVLKIEPFTLIGATTKSGFVSAPLLTRFANHLTLDYYEADILAEIILRNAKLLKIAITDDATATIALRSRGTPRICNNLFRFIRDFAQVKKIEKITLSVVQDACAMLSIDEKGLGEEDRKILRIIAEHYNNGPVGINTVAVATSMDMRTIANVYEPYLIKLGLLKITARGREITPLATQVLKEEQR